MTVMEELKLLLEAGGAEIEAAAYDRLQGYHQLLLEWNEKMDLTNVPEQEMAVRHYADSLLPLAHSEWFKEGAKLIDVGTGAGFPGLMLAIARPDLQVTLLDAQRKRCDFLQTVCDTLNLKNVTVLHARAEDGARGNLRETMDLAVARAVAPLNVLSEYLVPYVKIGGYALCWKGPAVKDELEEGKKAAQMLGGKAEELIRLPIEGREHYIQPIKKMVATARRYPRKSGTPSKEPLGSATPKGEKKK
ncbi:MAG: 16S rRNA (guanine(527)-N(7))-methyltransferase RsmG [Clostridia bacterium]|nr:16S rRNA (guanine(527)-N(7))-methyltransferase RsmG [Clostridia bacterium]